MSFVLIRLESYSTIYYSKALEEYEAVQSDKNLWTCYLLSLVAPPDAIKIDIDQDPEDREHTVVRYGGEEITVRMPAGSQSLFTSPYDARLYLGKYIIRTIILEVCLDNTFITKLFEELNERLQSYKSGGGTTLRSHLEYKCSVAVAIEPLLLGNWSKEWSSFQERYTKVISKRQFISIGSGGLTYKIWDSHNDFRFEMSSTFPEHKWWFPDAIVKTPIEPQFI